MAAPRVKDESEVREVIQVLGIGPHLDRRDLLLILKLAQPASLWKAILEVQFQACKQQELPFFHSSESFMKSKRVLEIGYGDDGLVGGLKNYFPDKEFTESPLPTRHIFGAKQKTKDCLEQIAAPVKEKNFDYIIVRVVVQRVSQLGLFVDTLKDFLAPKGTLLIMDSNDTHMKWEPAIPTMDNLMKNLIEEQAKQGAGRSAAEKIHRRASLYQLRPIRNVIANYRWDNDWGMREFYIYFTLMAELMLRGYGPILDQRALQDELDVWMQDPKGYGQVGLQLLELGRI